MKKSMAKRRAAFDLVEDCIKSSQRSVKWTELLSSRDIAYVKDVVSEMKRTPEAAPYVVARKLKEALGLTTSHETIAKTLKEMIANA